MDAQRFLDERRRHATRLLIVGRTRFRLEQVRVPRDPARATPPCLICRAPVPLARGDVRAVFSVGGEAIGVICDADLDDATRERLATLRARRDEVPR